MLNPKENRLDYGSILSSPPNYKLDFAVGTTYSLDLDALVGASISLGLSGEIDSDLNENPILLLEALRSTGNKIALFCESGQIKLPRKPTPLYVLLEDMVFQVINPNKPIHSRYASFHPKFWLLRFTNNENHVRYKVIVLSRNLTFDRSWDLSFSMDGEIRNGQTSKNDSLIRFIEYLSSYSTNEDKINKMNEIIDELKSVRFKTHSNAFGDFEFIVNGIDDKHSIQNQHLFYANSLKDILIMSPFLSRDVIRDFNSRLDSKSKAILITRLRSLSQLKDESLDNFEFYTLKDEVIDGESQFSEESQQISNQDIHAKMYVVEKNKCVDLYLGSLNASHNALYGNVEFMIKLSARKTRFNIKKLLKDLFNGGGDSNPFQPVDIKKIEIEPEKDSKVNMVIKDIVRLNAQAEIKSHDDKYDIEVKFDKFYEEFGKFTIKMRPLLSQKTLDFSKRMLFENIEKVKLSEFFVVCVSDGENTAEKVIKIPVDNLPQDREKDVISRVISDKTAFIRYVAFLLGDEYILTPPEITGENPADILSSFAIQLPELYEKMLKSSIYAPEKFTEIEFLIKTLSDDDVIPEGFEELYNTFKRVID